MMSKTVVRAAALAALLSSVAPAALAQAVSTVREGAASGISQEQALALTARLDALEQQNNELRDQVADLKAQVGAGEQAIRKDVAAQPKVTLSNARPQIATADGNFKFALRSVVQFDAADYDVKPLRADNDLQTGTN